MKVDVHMCLISGQATPNLTPLLSPDFMPRKVVMLVSEDMRERARWLLELLELGGLGLEILARLTACAAQSGLSIFPGLSNRRLELLLLVLEKV